MRIVYFSGKEGALRTAGTKMLWKWSLATSQPSSFLGSSRRLLTAGCGGGTGMVFVVSQDASAAESVLLVVATADGQFQFPGSVVTEFKLDAADGIHNDGGRGSLKLAVFQYRS